MIDDATLWAAYGRMMSRTRPGEPVRTDFTDVKGECDLFTGALDKDGYGKVGIRYDGKVVMFRAHRLAYQWKYGPIPEGMVIDHVCKNRACVNWGHLQAIEPAENTDLAVEFQRIRNHERTHCDHGHPFTPANTYTPKGSTARYCRTCHRNRQRARRKS